VGRSHTLFVFFEIFKQLIIYRLSLSGEWGENVYAY